MCILSLTSYPKYPRIPYFVQSLPWLYRVCTNPRDGANLGTDTETLQRQAENYFRGSYKGRTWVGVPLFPVVPRWQLPYFETVCSFMHACGVVRYGLLYRFLYMLCGFNTGSRYLLYRVLPLHSLVSSVRFLHEERLGNARGTRSVTSPMGHLEEIS